MLHGLLGDIRTVSVIGMCKNAGKTTALNAFISACDKACEAIGLTSIGRDGERSDIVTNTKKPEIYVQRGTVIATAELLLSQCDISREILESTSIPTPLGNIIIVRAMSAGYVQIGGPSMTEGLMDIRDSLIDLKCARVFIDGAISRKSLGTPQLADGVVLCSGASYNPDMRICADDTAYTALLFSLPEYSGEGKLSPSAKYTVFSPEGAVTCDSSRELASALKSSGAATIFINGAVTDKTAAELISCGKTLENASIAAMDASRLLLNRTSFDKLMRFSAGVSVLKSAKLLAVTVNPFSAYGNHYSERAYKERTEEAMLALGLKAPVINIMEV